MGDMDNGVRVSRSKPASGGPVQKTLVFRFPESERGNPFVRAFMNGIASAKKELVELNAQLDRKQSELVSLCVEVERSIGVLMQNAELVRADSEDADALNSLLHRLNIEHASIRSIRHLSSTSKSALRALFVSEKTVNQIKKDVVALETRLNSEQAAKPVPSTEQPVSSAEESKHGTLDARLGTQNPELAAPTSTEAQSMASEPAQAAVSPGPVKDAEIVLANGDAALATPSSLCEENLEIKRVRVDERRKAAVREAFMIMIHFGVRSQEYEMLIPQLGQLVLMGQHLRDGFTKSKDPDDVAFYLDSLSREIDEIMGPVRELHDIHFNVLVQIKDSHAEPGSNCSATKNLATAVAISPVSAETEDPDSSANAQVPGSSAGASKPETGEAQSPEPDAQNPDDWSGMCSGDDWELPEIVDDRSNGVDYLGREFGGRKRKNKR